MSEEEKIYISMYSRNAELYHHGIKGQQWGVTNGPPYPLDSDVSTGKRLKKEAKQSEKLETYKQKQRAIDKAKHDRELKSLNKYTAKNAEKIEKAKNQGKNEKVDKLISKRDKRLTEQAIRNGMHAINNKALDELTYEEMRKEQKAANTAETVAFVGSALASFGLQTMGVPFIIAAGVNKQGVREDVRMNNYYKKHPEE